MQLATILIIAQSILHMYGTAEASAAVDYHDYQNYYGGGPTVKHCYSCMSSEFQLHWPYLEEVYYKPMNFTDQCFKINPQMYIGRIPCSNSMCITVIEPRILAGQHVGNNIIRGCFAHVFRHAPTFAYSLKAIDTSCQRVPAYRLLPPRFASRSSNRSVELCYCVGQLCNDYPSVAIDSTSSNSRLLLMASFLLILVMLEYR